MGEITISDKESQLDYEESTIRLWKLIAGPLSEKFDRTKRVSEMSRQEAEQNLLNIQRDLQELRKLARDSPHFGQILEEQPAAGTYELIEQIKTYTRGVKREIRPKMQESEQKPLQMVYDMLDNVPVNDSTYEDR